jgi:hypothetical protein
MPTNIVYDGTDLSLVSNRNFIDSGTVFFVDTFNETPTLETGTVHADSIISNRFLCVTAPESDRTNLPISGALDIVNALKIMQNESKRYSIDKDSLQSCERLRPHISELIIKQRLVSCFVFTQLIPIMLSAIQELNKNVQALSKKSHNSPTVHCCDIICDETHDQNFDWCGDEILAKLGVCVSDSSGYTTIRTSLLAKIVKHIKEQDEYITLLKRLVDYAPVKVDNIVLGGFYVHRRRL